MSYQDGVAEEVIDMDSLASASSGTYKVLQFIYFIFNFAFLHSFNNIICFGVLGGSYFF